VVTIDLSTSRFDGGLKGTLSWSLGNLSLLATLNNSHNFHLMGIIPSEFGHLKELQVLDLTWNEFVGSIPVELGKLKALQVLDLSGNELGGSIPVELGQLKALRVLDLSYNFALTGRIPPEFGQLKAL
jgi:Leucine-rich repeat (LRR) protein